MKEFRIYSDESRHKNERFLLLSGLWIEEENVDTVENRMLELRKKYGFTNDEGKFINFCGELKWTKISSKYYPIYQELVDLFFDWIEKDVFRYCCMLVDTQDDAVINFSNIKKEGYFKLLYQLYFHNSKIPGVYKIYPDSIKNPTQDQVDFNVLDKCLDKALYKKFKPLVNPADLPDGKGFLNNITPTNSKQSEFIQIIDVIMGALGYFQNRHFKKEGSKQAKIDLMKYVIDKLMYSGIMQIQSKKFMIAKSTKFNIWMFKPYKKDLQC